MVVWVVEPSASFLTGSPMTVVKVEVVAPAWAAPFRYWVTVVATMVVLVAASVVVTTDYEDMVRLAALKFWVVTVVPSLDVVIVCLPL